MKVLIIGASGMLGHCIFHHLSSNLNLDVYGLLRDRKFSKFFIGKFEQKLDYELDLNNLILLRNKITQLLPTVVINCVGVHPLKNDANKSDLISINALFPHQLNEICQPLNTRLIHFSTDGIFSGSKGDYIESDLSDSNSFYGKSKFLGEISNPNFLTIRTSFIGHELGTDRNLLDWFLSQSNSINAYKNVIFSGITTFEMARILDQIILKNNKISGLFHISSKPISKYNLLAIVGEIYNHPIKLLPDENYISNLTLNSNKFQQLTNYHAPTWRIMISQLKDFYNAYK